jgi:hypothetical protein
LIIQQVLLSEDMDILNEYLKTLVFTRVEDKQGYVIYGAGISGMFGAGKQRYILLFVPSHLATSSQARASELPWQNLQTRNLQYSYRLKKQTWNPSQELPNPQFRVIGRTGKYSTYRGPEEFPFEVLLINDPKKKTKYQYHNHLSLYGVLESFNSVINYIGEHRNPRVNSEYQSKPTHQDPPQLLPLPVNYDQMSNGEINDQFELL